MLNRREVCISKVRSNSLCILESGIEAALPSNVMKSIFWDFKKKILSINGSKIKVNGRIFVVGVGKASVSMLLELNKIIGADICAGVILSDEKTNFNLRKIDVYAASHPLPSKKNLLYTSYLLNLKNKYMINQNDLVLCLISGGGSAMLEDSFLSYHSLRKINKYLIMNGANITEINLVRKLISNVKAGGLALHFQPANVIGLILSDVSKDVSVVASGPTMLEDESYIELAKQVLLKYSIDLPFNFEAEYSSLKIKNFLLANNLVSLKSMFNKAKKLGYNPVIINNSLTGNPADASIELLHKIFTEIKHEHKNCFLFAGETLPKVGAKFSKGGRNQHFVLLMHDLLKDYDFPWCISSIATDGKDYLKGIGGAIIDNSFDRRIDSTKYVLNFRSYCYFKKLKHSLIKMNSTGTNVGDLGVIII